MRVFVALAVVALAGCPADDHMGVDGGTDRGLAVGWVTRPYVVPGPIEDDYDVASAVFHLRNLRVVGDAGAGDPRTTAAVASLGWSAEAQPDSLWFPEAPAGLYARMLWTIDGGSNPAWEVRGTALILGTRQPYLIRDTQPLPIDFDYQIMAEAGTRTTIVVRVEFKKLLDQVDFDEVPVIGGVHTITGADPQLTALRTELADAFGVHPSDQ